MKTHKVVIEMAFLVSKKMKFPQILEIDSKKLFELFGKVHSTKWENAFEVLNDISFVT